MKIGILTQPLYSNYGGLLQAWALQKTLVDLGHSATIINRVWGTPQLKLWRKNLGKLKGELLILIGKRKRYLTATEDLRRLAETYIIPFKELRYLGISPELKSNEELLDFVKKADFDGYIVGSDQVWRPRYSPNLMTYFLDFVKDNNKVKKIAYAASFGVDNWELSTKETEEARKLTPLFDLITVRESSGIDLVEKFLNCHATHVLDPTMLRSKEDYINLINQSTSKLHKSNGDMFCYVLDQNEKFSSIIKSCEESTCLNPYYCNYEIPFNRLTKKDKRENCIVPPIEQWLKSFIDAKMVITDSFHGMVFSIIFNKPFWVITNKERGRARFSSLLKLFGLENRIISDTTRHNWKEVIDWDSVNIKKEQLSTKSKYILQQILSITNDAKQ